MIFGPEMEQMYSYNFGSCVANRGHRFDVQRLEECNIIVETDVTCLVDLDLRQSLSSRVCSCVCHELRQISTLCTKILLLLTYRTIMCQ